MSVNTKVNGELVKSAGLYKASVPIQSGDIYSLEERQVGVWTDGKPLYQKTINFGALPNATTKAVSTGFESGAIDVVKMTGFALNPTSDVTLAIPRASSTTTDAIDLVVIQSNGYECVRLATASNYSVFTESYITIQYTKTTDVAGSGEYVPSGDKAVHYSTEEEVIGTWIDGSTLYRKTINFGALPNATDKSVAHGISNLGYVCKADAVGHNTTNGSRIPFPMTNSSNLNQQVLWWINDTSVVFRTAVDYSSTNVCYVTLEYTKTS